MSVFCPYENPVFCGKKLNLQPIRPEMCQHYPVYRPKDTIFAYAAWPTVTRDENGTLYASSSAFAFACSASILAASASFANLSASSYFLLSISFKYSI